MKKTLSNISYSKNIELLRKIIAECKVRLMRGGPLKQFPHYWALIPVEPQKMQDHRKNLNRDQRLN